MDIESNTPIETTAIDTETEAQSKTAKEETSTEESVRAEEFSCNDSPDENKPKTPSKKF